MLNITKTSSCVIFFIKQFAIYLDLKTMLDFLCQGKVAVMAPSCAGEAGGVGRRAEG